MIFYLEKKQQTRVAIFTAFAVEIYGPKMKSRLLRHFFVVFAAAAVVLAENKQPNEKKHEQFLVGRLKF